MKSPSSILSSARPKTAKPQSRLVEKYQHFRMADRAFDLAWTHGQVILRQLNATEAEAQLYARLAGAIIYADPARRATSGILLENRRGQSALWTYGISGDTPLVLLRATDLEKIETRAPTHPGAFLLARERFDGRARDFERRRFGLSPEFAGSNYIADRSRQRSANAR